MIALPMPDTFLATSSSLTSLWYSHFTYNHSRKYGLIDYDRDTLYDTRDINPDIVIKRALC